MNPIVGLITVLLLGLEFPRYGYGLALSGAGDNSQAAERTVAQGIDRLESTLSREPWPGQRFRDFGGLPLQRWPASLRQDTRIPGSS